MSKKLGLVAAIALFSCNVLAADVQAPATTTNVVSAAVVLASGITIESPWARASTTENTAVYCVIKNTSDHDIVLTGASSDEQANRGELHETYQEIVDGKEVLKMRSVDKIVIPAGSFVEFKPGSTHIMLMGLKKHLVADELIKVKLILDDHGKTHEEIIDVLVKNYKKQSTK